MYITPQLKSFLDINTDIILSGFVTSLNNKYRPKQSVISAGI